MLFAFYGILVICYTEKQQQTFIWTKVKLLLTSSTYNRDSNWAHSCWMHWKQCRANACICFPTGIRRESHFLSNVGCKFPCISCVFRAHTVYKWSPKEKVTRSKVWRKGWPLNGSSSTNPPTRQILVEDSSRRVAIVGRGSVLLIVSVLVFVSSKERLPKNIAVSVAVHCLLTCNLLGYSAVPSFSPWKTLLSLERSPTAPIPVQYRSLQQQIGQMAPQASGVRLWGGVLQRGGECGGWLS